MNHHAAALIDTLGIKAVADRIGVVETAVHNARRGIPSRWFVRIRNMCAENGVECPEDAFNWAPPPKRKAEATQ